MYQNKDRGYINLFYYKPLAKNKQLHFRDIRINSRIHCSSMASLPSRTNLATQKKKHPILLSFFYTYHVMSSPTKHLHDWHWMHAMWFHNLTIASISKEPQNTISFNALIHIRHYWHHNDVLNNFFAAWAIHIKSFLDFQRNFKQLFNTCKKEKKVDLHIFNVNRFLPSTYL